MTNTPPPTSPPDPLAAGQDEALFRAMDELVEIGGVNPASPPGKRVREIIHTALKLIGDGANLGEIKLISRSIKELRYALKVFRPHRQTRKCSVFGSARTRPDHPTYLAAAEFAHQMAEAGWMIITGAGDGIMRAGNGGAGKEKSFGVSIRLPFETNANDYIVGDPKLITFRYFFTRKLMFMWEASAVALFAGGFGTQDEGFEALTLVQTGKAPIVPIVLVDAPGGTYWKNWDRYVREELLAHQLISPEDLNLYHRTDDPADAARHILNFYRNYHSQRFVQDDMVIRMNRPLRPDQVAELNDRFGVLIARGKIVQRGPLEAEREFPDKPRLVFTHTKRGYGTVRALIDRINEMDAPGS